MFALENFQHWLHVLSAVIWIGSILYTWWVTVPSAVSAYPLEESIFHIVNLEKKFKKVAHPVMVIIIVTGVMNLISAESMEKMKASPVFGILLAVKLLLLTFLIAAHVHRHTHYSKRILAAATGNKVDAAGLEIWKKSKRLLVLQGIAGLIIIFIGVSLESAV
jgi:uncharacterized membrane protein